MTGEQQPLSEPQFQAAAKSPSNIIPFLHSSHCSPPSSSPTHSSMVTRTTTVRPCFTLSTTTFLPAHAKLRNICRTAPPTTSRPLLPIRRIRATTTEADAESPQDVQPPQQISDDEFEEQVPGKIVLTDLELAKQKTALDQYAKELRQKRIAEEREAARLFGFVPYAETLNGRLAMFFIVVGLLTEYWTGYTIPEQVEMMLRTLGVI